MSSGFKVRTWEALEDILKEFVLCGELGELGKRVTALRDAINERISDTRAILLDLRRRVDNLETMAGEFHCSDQPAAPTAEEALDALAKLVELSQYRSTTGVITALVTVSNAKLRAFIEAHDD